MFDFIKRLFGEGWIHYSGVTKDRRPFKGKTEYIGEFDSEEEVLALVRKKIEARYNVEIASMKISIRPLH